MSEPKQREPLLILMDHEDGSRGADLLFLATIEGDARLWGPRPVEYVPSPGAALARVLDVLLAPDPRGQEARQAFATEAGLEQLTDRDAGVLARALEAPLERLRALIGPGDDAWWAGRDGLLAADAALLDVLHEHATEKVDAARQKLRATWGSVEQRVVAARKVALRRSTLLTEPVWILPREEGAGELIAGLWSRWLTPEKQLQALVRHVWPGVRERLLQAGGAALVASNLERVIDSMIPKRTARRAPEVQGRFDLLLEDGRVVGRVDADQLRFGGPTLSEQVVERIVAPTSSVLGLRVVRYVVHDTFERWVKAPARFRPEIEIEGGIQAFAELLGARGHKQAEELREVLDGFASYRVDFGRTGHTWILQWSRIPHAPGRAARVILTPGDVFRPGFASALDRRTPGQREDARLVPIPRRAPAGVLSPQFHAREQALQLFTMQELAERSPELVDRGAVQLSDRDWRRLGDRAGLSWPGTQRVVDGWQRGEDRFLELAAARWRLGPAYRTEWTHLETLGAMRNRARARGLRSARRRRQ